MVLQELKAASNEVWVACANQINDPFVMVFRSIMMIYFVMLVVYMLRLFSAFESIGVLSQALFQMLAKVLTALVLLFLFFAISAVSFQLFESQDMQAFQQVG